MTKGQTDPRNPHLVRDESAGFHRVHPTPSVDTLKKLYGHEYYARDKPVYLEKTAQELAYWHGIWDLRLAAMAQALDTGNRRILDVGASGGFFLARARDLDWEIAGVEPSIQSVTHAKEKLGIGLTEGYLEDLNASEPCFDAVHMALVLEHVRDPRAFLRHALALLRPGGVIWVEVPNDFNPFQAAIVDRLNKDHWWVVPHHHLNYFDFHSLTSLLKELEAEELDRLGSFPMELFPLMGMDYIGDDKVGAEAHGHRMNLEKNLLAHNPQVLLTFYRALAAAGLGRTCNVLARKLAG